MKIKDKLIIKHKDDTIKEMVYISSTQNQHLFSEEKDIVGVDSSAILWAGEVGTTKFLPIKKKHDFIKIDENTWSLDIEPINSNDL